MPRLSAILICHNEAAHLATCLEALAFVDELIVVDSGSTDDTQEIARTYTDHVHEIAWRGFGQQKNAALDLATGDWVLSVDADEVVSEALADAIRHAINTESCAGYILRRRNWMAGRIVRFGDWGADRVVRLARRDRARFTDDPVHEQLTVRGQLRRIRPPLDHFFCRDLDAFKRKISRYSAISARQALAAGRRGNLTTAAIRAAWSFTRNWLIRGGLFDGRTGLSAARLCARATWLKRSWIARGRVPEEVD